MGWDGCEEWKTLDDVIKEVREGWPEDVKHKIVQMEPIPGSTTPTYVMLCHDPRMQPPGQEKYVWWITKLPRSDHFWYKLAPDDLYHLYVRAIGSDVTRGTSEPSRSILVLQRAPTPLCRCILRVPHC